MIEMFHRYLIPAAYSVLPPAMASPKATSFILAIGLQESQFRDRRQVGGGPGRGFFQFERGGGVRGVVTHAASRDALRAALVALREEKLIGQTVLLYQTIEHHDVLAVVFARLLIYTLPDALPGRDEADVAWSQYLRAWNPGEPRRESWPGHFQTAWALVAPEDEDI